MANIDLIRRALIKLLEGGEGTARIPREVSRPGVPEAPIVPGSGTPGDPLFKQTPADPSRIMREEVGPGPKSFEDQLLMEGMFVPEGEARTFRSQALEDPFLDTPRKFENLPETPEKQAAIEAAIRDPKVPTKRVPPGKEEIDFEGEEFAKEVERIQGELIGEGKLGRAQAGEDVIHKVQASAARTEINAFIQDTFTQWKELFPQFSKKFGRTEKTPKSAPGAFVGETDLKVIDVEEVAYGPPAPPSPGFSDLDRALQRGFRKLSSAAADARNPKASLEVRQDGFDTVTEIKEWLSSGGNIDDFPVGRQAGQVRSSVGNRDIDFIDPFFGVE
jgi:hypothetical protein